MTEKASQGNTTAAIVCSHVAKLGYPILLAERGNSLEPEDSGWQFLCDSGEVERENEAQVWALGEVVDWEPSLAELMDAPSGTTLVRKSRTHAWEIRHGHREASS